MLRLILIALPVAACALPRTPQETTTVAAPALSLPQIMQDPDWLGRGPESSFWADDGRSIYFRRKRAGSSLRDLFRIDLATGQETMVTDEDRAFAELNSGWRNEPRTLAVESRNGDLFLKDLTSGEIDQLTRTSTRETSPRFMSDDRRIQYRRGESIVVRELANGHEYEPADLRFEDDPDDKEEDTDYLGDQQERLFEILRKRESNRDEARERERELHAADATRAPKPFYLGKGKRQTGTELSPDGRWMIVEVAPPAQTGKRDTMPEYVTASSWVETREVRAHVGYSNRAANELILLDLESHERFDLDLSVLPGLNEDPLAWLDEEPDDEDQEASEQTDEAVTPPRGLSIWNVLWSLDGRHAAFIGRTLDCKDRYIGYIDLARKTVLPVHRLSDEAWVNFRFNEYGWMSDSSGLWFLSEETGHSQLYLWSPDTKRTRALTEGEFEVDSITLFEDQLFYRANASHPGIHEVWQLDVPSGERRQLTNLGGKTSYSLSVDGTQLLLTHSKLLEPSQLYVQDAVPGAEPRQLTDTLSEEFRSFEWAKPDIVEIPMRDGGTIYGRFYAPKVMTSSLQPAVLFVHGAGYMQNVHFGWSSYFREFMFHSFLVEQGYTVLDIDYRASAGYGRDWRTAIYRQMGTPELEDYEDAIGWLVENHSVDPERIGMYGGSYGGFLTLMALFKKPEMLACGAALRPVTDWAHYNHGYTSNILNTPERDPKAFEASSPIEFAEGLVKPLLMCHGMLDDNVLAKDSIRLAQRLIELEKEDWELALYPIEPHGFREPSSWLDEYRRIFKLFETHLR